MPANESYEDRFVHYVTLPSLEEIASTQIALSIWYSYVSHSKFEQRKKAYYRDRLIPAFGLDENYADELEKLIECFEAPRIIRILSNRMRSIRHEITEWVQYFTHDIFPDKFLASQFRIARLDSKYCVWLANGTIDYERSAAKMLRSSGLSEVQKFAIMCKFCMENEIRTVAIDSIPPVVIERMRPLITELLCYWICYLKNELHEIPTHDFNSVDAAMAAACGYKTDWAAFQYFWDRLSAEDQLSVVRLRLSLPFINKHYEDYDDCEMYNLMDRLPDRLISKMSWHQQHQLLSQVPEQIVLNSVLCSQSQPYASWAWRNSRHSMTDEQFADMVKLMYDIVPFRGGHVGMNALIEIWDTALDHHRTYAEPTIEKMIIVHLSGQTGNPLVYNYNFVCKFLSMKDAESRKKLIFENAGTFGSCIGLPNLFARSVIDLCLPNAEDLDKFKEKIIYLREINYRWFSFFDMGNFNCLTWELKVYLPKSEVVVRDFMKFFLTSALDGIRFRNHYFKSVYQWAGLSKFIDDMFSHDVSAALYMKKIFISLYVTRWSDLRCYDVRRLDDIMIAAESICSDEELQIIKEACSISFRNILADEEHGWWRFYYDEQYFHRIRTWCFGDDEESIRRFKNAVPVDAIFDGVFYALTKQYLEQPSWDFDSRLIQLDAVLLWYLTSAEEVKKYKMDKVSYDMEIFVAAMERNDTTALDKLANWFFEGDHTEMRKFGFWE